MRMKKIIGLTYLHANQALATVTDYWCDNFSRLGHETISLDLNAPDGGKRLQELLSGGDVEFCFGQQGVGSRLTIGDESVWTHFRTPFLGMHADNPSCNIYNHFCDSPYVANLYQFECLFDIQKRYVKNAQFNDHIPYEIDWMGANNLMPFARRPLRIVFMKSGKSPAPYADNLNQVKPPLREALWAAVEKAWRDENLVICDLLAEAFKACGLDRAQYWNEFWGFADWIDNYIRCKRAADLVEWLKFQPGAVIVGDGWDFIDKTGAKAIFKPSVPALEARTLYEQAQYLCNTSPYGSNIIHERIYLGLGTLCYVLTDTNAWWDRHFAAIPSLCRFRWGEDWRARLEAALNDPQAGEKADSIAGLTRMIDKLNGTAQIPKIVATAGRVRDFAEQKLTLDQKQQVRGS